MLRPRDESCRRELKQAFEQAIQVRPEVLKTLLTHEGDREMFRQVYPFSPALVQTLVAVSSVLQRERTALKIMLQLLVEKRETLRVGDLIPCGDLWDMVAHGEEAFSDVMRSQPSRMPRNSITTSSGRSSKRPATSASTTTETAPGPTPRSPSSVSRFDNDDRLVKTLLLSALVPEVEPLKDLTASRAGRAESRHDQSAARAPTRRRVVLNRCGPGPAASARSASARGPTR